MTIAPACSVRLYIGAGVPGKVGKYKGLPVSFDKEAFRDHVETMVKSKFANATFFKTRGVWKGGSEDGYMVEVIMSPQDGRCDQVFRKAEGLARNIAIAFGQEAVMLVAVDTNGGVHSDLVQAAA